MRISKKNILSGMFVLMFAFFAGCLEGNSTDPTPPPNPPANSLPVVSLSASPNSGNTPLTVQFIASANDSDGSVVKYEWDFDYNGVYDSTSTGNSVSHIYSIAGVYTPKVRVTDNGGAMAEATAQVTVTTVTDTTALDTTVATVIKTISFTASGSPSNNSVYLEEVGKNNDQITLAVKVKGGTDVCGAILEINFDGSRILYVSSAEGGYLNQGLSGTTTFSAGLEQGSTGVLLIGVAKKGFVPGVTGDGVLAQIVLKVLNTQTSTAISFNVTNSTLKLSTGANITGTSFLGGNLSYQ